MARQLVFRNNALVLTKHFGMLRVVYVDKSNPHDYLYLGRTFNNEVSYNFTLADVKTTITQKEFDTGKLDD